MTDLWRKIDAEGGAAMSTSPIDTAYNKGHSEALSAALVHCEALGIVEGRAVIHQDIVERMMALVHDLHADHVAYDMHDREQDFCKRTAAIAAELPKPVDPDLIEARKIADDFSVRANIRRAEPYAAGNNDADGVVPALMAAIQRGRELERAA